MKAISPCSQTLYSEILGLFKFTSSFLRKLRSAFFTAICFSASCSAIELPQYKIEAIDTYEYRQSRDGLIIAIQPFTRKERSEEYFGADLLSERVLAVLILAENRSANSSYILSRDRLKLMPEGVPPTEDVVRERLKPDRTSDALAFAGSATLFGGALFAPLAGVGLPLTFVGHKLRADANEIKYNLALKELYTRTISPGRVVSGFVYFKIPENVSIESWVMTADVTNLQTAKSLTLAIPFKFKWDGR